MRATRCGPQTKQDKKKNKQPQLPLSGVGLDPRLCLGSSPTTTKRLCGSVGGALPDLPSSCWFPGPGTGYCHFVSVSWAQATFPPLAFLYVSKLPANCGGPLVPSAKTYSPNIILGTRHQQIFHVGLTVRI